MIIYDLACSAGHQFEAWFRHPDDFGTQLANHHLCCPQCGCEAVRRVPSPVAISTPKTVQRKVLPRGQAQAEQLTQQQLVVALQEVISKVVARTEDVGNQFAAEARRIHYHEVETRPIRGTASQDDVAALLDEGIDVLPLPKLPKRH